MPLFASRLDARVVYCVAHWSWYTLCASIGLGRIFGFGEKISLDSPTPCLTNCPSTRALERQQHIPHEDQLASGVSCHKCAPVRVQYHNSWRRVRRATFQLRSHDMSWVPILNVPSQLHWSLQGPNQETAMFGTSPFLEWNVRRIKAERCLNLTILQLNQSLLSWNLNVSKK